MTRRGFFSVNALWKNKIAVLVGDYLLSKGLLISVEKDTFDLLKISATAIQEMSEGELLQQERSRRMNVDEDIYFQIIQQKTASLIAACCQMGGAAVYATEADQRKLYVLGQKIGLAFQIKDDLLDLGFGENIGKPIGADIQEHKLTLPLIHALKNGSNDCKKKIKSILKKKNIDASDIKLIQDELIISNSIQYSEDVMRKITDEALDILHELPTGEVNQSLQQLVKYSIERKK
jgi:octaprenyl-diphosphate synthase